MTSDKTNLPGTIWINRGRWNWRVKLPGTDKRLNYPLRLPGEDRALSADNDRSLAEAIAWRMLERQKPHDVSPDPTGVKTLNDVCVEFLRWARTYYLHSDGSTTGETQSCETALRFLQELYGRKPINDIVYGDISSARDKLVSAGHKRPTVNKKVGIWKRMFSWALENRLCSAHAKSEVWAITALKRFRSPAPEGGVVRPVDHTSVMAAAEFMPPVLRAMVLVEELCGARPIEICLMRPCDIDTTGEVWVYRPRYHKTEHKGLSRLIALGPRAQEILKPIMENIPQDRHIFRPKDLRTERNAVMRAKRKTKVQPSQICRKKENPSRPPGEAFNSAAYADAVKRACRAAGVEPWSPNQLRHSCGSNVRRAFGRESARIVLGHSASRITTDTYTAEVIEEENLAEASRVMLAIG